MTRIPDIDKRRKFILTLAKCLLTFGSPSHRVDTQLSTASNILDAKAAFVHIPDVIIVTFGDEDVASVETHFVKAKGQIALTPLHQVHLVYRKVLHDKITVEDGTEELKEILGARVIYSLWPRCLFAFFTAAMISAMVFGGSIIDMWISGLCACVLQYLGLNAASKSATYANVYELSHINQPVQVIPAYGLKQDINCNSCLLRFTSTKYDPRRSVLLQRYFRRWRCSHPTRFHHP